MNNQEQEASGVCWRIDEWFPDLSPDQKSKLKSYHGTLVSSAKGVTQLVSSKTIAFSDALHFADSILASRIIFSKQSNIASLFDFGSGAGFPGLIFGILYPSVKVTLVEHDLKKIEFLKSVVTSLNLQNIEFEGRSVETLSDGSVQFAITRGFSNISKTIMAARKCIPKGGALFHLKGEEWGIELADIPSQLCSMWSPALVGEYKLPIGNFKFAVIRTEKIS